MRWPGCYRDVAVRVDDLLNQLGAVRRTSRGWSARCPAHNDRWPSLSVAEGERGLLVKCFAGCTVKEICAALGLTVADLFFDAPRSTRQRALLPPRPSPVDWRIVSKEQLDRRDALDLRAARTLAAAKGVDLSPLTNEETDAMMDVVPDAYSDRELADRLDQAAFETREEGLAQKGNAMHSDAQAILDTRKDPSEKDIDRINESSEEPAPFMVLSWANLLARPKNARPWLVTGLMRPGWLVALHGHGKEGKTTLALHLMAALAGGIRWTQHDIPKAIPVMYIGFEMALEDLADLIEPIQRGKVFSCTPEVVCDWPAPLDLHRLESFLSKRETPGLLVLDTFRAAFMLKREEENDAGVIGQLLRGLQRIARVTGWTILVIHHQKKSGSGGFLDGAGSGEWLSAPDAVWTWTRPPGNEIGTLRVTGRMPPVTDMSVRLSPLTCEYFGPTLQVDVGFSDDEILRHVPDADRGLSIEAIRKGWGEKAPAFSTLSARLNNLAVPGPDQKVEKLGSGAKGSPYRYRLVTNASILPASIGSDQIEESEEEVNLAD